MDLINVGYAVFLSIGGVAGYISKKSIPSLVFSLLFASLLVFTSRNLKTRASHLMPLLILLFLAGFMGKEYSSLKIKTLERKTHTIKKGYRSISTGKFMPSGLVSVTALLMALRSASIYLSLA